MGQEIDQQNFSKKDFARYEQLLRRETGLLGRYFREDRLNHGGHVAGFELEAWLVGKDWRPVPINEPYLARLETDQVSPELSRFNIELNGEPRAIEGNFLSRLHSSLQDNWDYCRGVAVREFGADLVMIGILPSLGDEHLTLENMSAMVRYRALNEQVMRIRKGRPLHLDINGREHLVSEHHDVMLESATTSFQVHLQVDPTEAVRFYNASIIASAATVAVSANSPYLFGKDLWDETRIPLFEQSVDIGGINGAARGPLHRVSFGSDYVRESLMECFRENSEHFPVLLPISYDSEPEQFNHLRLHNGTIWRWNRPLIGFDEDDQVHLRIEHRVIPSGPTVVDMIANAALYYGLVHSLASMQEGPETRLPFHLARDNFYKAAKNGLRAQVNWFDGKKGNLGLLLREELIPLARSGLERMDVSNEDIRTYLGIIQQRVETGRNGAAWQRAWVESHGRDMQALTAAYHEQQETGSPVHEWNE